MGNHATLCGMAKKPQLKPQIRLDPDNENVLNDIRHKCTWPVSLNVLANHVMRWGLGRTRQRFLETPNKIKI